MTSKNSYFNWPLIYDKIRKNTWVITLYSVILFFAMPVFLVIQLQGINSKQMQNKDVRMKQVVSEFFCSGSNFITMLAIPAAIIAAAAVFYYINSKKQIDFYHSLPLKREKLFATNYLSGVMLYLIPYTVCVILSVIVISAMGYISYINPLDILSGYLLNLLFFLVIYAITILAMMLCGNIVVSLLGTAVFLLYGPALCTAYTELMGYFYKNFYKLFRINSMVRNTSPIFDFMEASKSHPFTASRVISYVILTTMLTILSIYLYKKRPSEASGHAMAFKISMPIIKYPIVFLCALIFGISFKSVGGGSTEWMVFGFICGGTLSHFIIEVIYNFDFKAIFKNLKGLGIFAAVFTVLIMVPAFDLTGYDKRLPELSNIKSVKLNIKQFNQNSYFMDTQFIGGINREKTMLDRHKLSSKENIDAVFNIAKMGVQNTGKDEDKYDANVGVEFELKNGSKIRRDYGYLKSSEIVPYMTSIFDTEEFKRSLYLLYSMDKKDVLQIKVANLYPQGVNITGQIKSYDKISLLMDAISSDLLNLKAEDMKTETPVMLIDFVKVNTKSGIVQLECKIPVYPSFTQTIEALESMGIERPKIITAEMVDYIQVSSNEYEKNIEKAHAIGEAAVQTAPVGRNEIRITDKKEIEEVLKYIVPAIAANYDPFFERDYRYDVNVFSSSNLDGYNESFVFMKDSIPEFIKKSFPINSTVK